MKDSLFTIFEKANKISSIEDRAAFLNQNNSAAMQTILTLAFDNRITWAVPEGEPPYKPAEKDQAEGKINVGSTLRQIKQFINGQGMDHLPKGRREQAFISFLETIDPDDAKLMLYIKDNKKLPQRKLNKKFIAKAFPQLLNWEEQLDDVKEDE